MAVTILGIRLEEEYRDVDMLLDDMHKAAKKTKNILYRGISRDVEKYPNLMRVWHGGKTNNLYRKEFVMLRQFYREGASLLQNSYGALDLVCAAQHFGVPTRLIDWTYNPFVALFFALNAQPSEDKDFGYRIFLCDKREQLALPDIYSGKTYEQLAMDISDPRVEMFEGFTEILAAGKETIEKICARAKLSEYQNKLENFVVLEAGNANPRINAQKGMFVIPRRLSREEIDREYARAGVKTIRLAPSVRKQALVELENLGYSRLNLFFDLQNICQYIKEKALEA